MIDPPPALVIGPVRARMPRNVPRTLTARHPSKAAVSMSARWANGMMAALLTSTLAGPNRVSVDSTKRAQLSSSVTSSPPNVTPSPISSASARPSSSRRSPMTTVAPSAAKRRAIAAPILREPPATTATRPCNRPCGFSDVATYRSAQASQSSRRSR